MSIASELSRIISLRRELTATLIEKGVISSGDHDLEDDVIAVEALNYNHNYQTKSVALGSGTPPTVTYDSGYEGLLAVNLSLSAAISGDKIVQGHKILGINGEAQSVINLKKVYWSVTATNTTNITLLSSGASCYPSGSFTPGNALPNIGIMHNDKEVIVLRYARPSGNLTYEELNFGIKAYDQGGAVYSQTVKLTNGSPELVYPGGDLTMVLNSDSTRLSLTLSNNVKFNGSYFIQIAYE